MAGPDQAIPTRLPNGTGRSSRRRRSGAVALCLVGSLLAQRAAAANPAAGSVAAVEFVAPAGLKLDQVARFVRAGRPVKAAKIESDGLQNSDQIFLRDAESVLILRMVTTGEVRAVKRARPIPPGSPDFTIQAPAIPGAPKRLFNMLAALYRAAAGSSFASGIAGDDRPNGGQYVLAASRALATASPMAACSNPGGKSNEPVRFRIPALSAFENDFQRGQRSMLIAWRGGVEPFAIRIQDEHRDVLSEVKDIRGRCAVVMPSANYAAGSYTVTATDGNRTNVVVAGVHAAEQAPSAPREIAAANFPPDVATIYFASWLAAQNDGAWTWEAVQRVAALGCASPPAREWLAQHDATACDAGPIR
ncbi:hypothetical protein Q4F19_15705 [Sphingomonas sp. BIUV-7]|uniref:Uncharacterized protein n=1 Tax=Sphingomonas natans TaxID=3063330 RepID=A0ABT8YBY2_9SPHN|nr:hypothetical protein [Sphingomonas sp. BIUV-7]MDO6415837.1 hypothetical protein [Sphingomonas sp. BIUV-7]